MNPIALIAWFRRPTRVAPVIAFLLMLLLPTVSLDELLNKENVIARNDEVAKSFREAPYIIGDWIGKPVQVPTAAIEILRPNAILSRQFRRLDTGMSAQMIIIHCSSARDMHGHYPPKCYPANGWNETDTNDRQDIEVSFDGKDIQVRVYHFKMPEGLGSERSTRVLNFFILPNGEFTGEINEIGRIVSHLSLSALGVAQVQIVTSGDMPLENSIKAAEELLSGLSSIMTVLSQGSDYDYSN